MRARSALGSALAPLFLLTSCRVVATVLYSIDSGPPAEASESGTPDGAAGTDGAQAFEAGDGEQGAMDASVDASNNTSSDGPDDVPDDASADVSPDASADSGTPPSSAIGAGMNDVSILFPLPTSAADVDQLLAPSAIGDGGTLLPAALYASMGFLEGSTNVALDAGVPVPPFADPTYYPSIAAYDDLRVLAMRIDPCFASLAPDPSGAGCTAQLRLVFQEVRWVGDGGAAVFDSAIHASYDLSRAQLLALAGALVDLRTNNENGDALGPLAPHPIMVRQGLAGPMSQGVQRLILAYAGEQNLVRTAESSPVPRSCPYGCENAGASWGMSAFDVSTPRTATPRAIPTLVGPDGGSVVAQGMGIRSDGLDVNPITTSSDDYSAIYNGGSVSLLPPSTLQAKLDALVRIENPKDTSANTIDCASCHLATETAMFVAAVQSFDDAAVQSFDDTASPLSYMPDGALVTRGNMKATFSISAGTPNIHDFSYLGPSPTISQRVVNETAAVVEYLNAVPQ